MQKQPPTHFESKMHLQLAYMYFQRTKHGFTNQQYKVPKACIYFTMQSYGCYVAKTKKTNSYLNYGFEQCWVSLITTSSSYLKKSKSNPKTFVFKIISS
jgi:hypothetical protein